MSPKFHVAVRGVSSTEGSRVRSPHARQTPRVGSPRAGNAHSPPQRPASRLLFFLLLLLLLRSPFFLFPFLSHSIEPAKANQPAPPHPPPQRLQAARRGHLRARRPPASPGFASPPAVPLPRGELGGCRGAMEAVEAALGPLSAACPRPSSRGGGGGGGAGAPRPVPMRPREEKMMYI